MNAISRLLGFLLRRSPSVCADVAVFGIGNPGDRFANTRHNAGFMAVDCMAESLTDAHVLRGPLFDATVGMLSGKKVALVKPLTFVNRCGEAFVESMRRLCVPQGSALVIVDDYHLPVGTIRIRRGGSAGGHNGLASIIENCGENFPRIRVGIGPLPAGAGSVDFVLGKFDEQEMPAVNAAVRTAAGAAAAFCTQGIDSTMNLFNSRRQAGGRADEVMA